MPRCTVQFKPAGKTVEVDTDKPADGVGAPGCLLNIAAANGVEIDNPCAGLGTCGLCYVVIEKGAENLSPMTDDEKESLEGTAPDPKVSRLACQAIVLGDVVCVVPT